MRKLLLSLAIAASGQAMAQQLPMQLWYAKPATFFEESLPLGNGRLGALVYGDPQEDLIQLNDITLWSGKPIDRQEDAGASRWIPEIRKALFAEDYALADSLQLHVQGHNSCHYQPLGTLHIVPTADQPSQSVTNYRRELSLDSALAHMSYQQGGVTFEREYLASAPDSLIAIRLKASQQGRLNVELKFSSLLPHSVKASQKQLTMLGHANGDATESIHFCTILRLANKDGQVAATDSSLLLTKATEATIWLVNATSFNGFDRHPVSQGAPYVDLANNRAWHTQNVTYNEVKARHVADYRQFFSRVSLRLSSKSSWHDDILDIPTDSLLEGYGKGSAAHKASVTGDTIGDTRKDVVGVALDIFIKLMSTVANTIAPIIRNFRIFG
ncbi:MAG: sodium/proton-translocating pyrophosphatase [Prevotella sp.]